MVVPLRIRSIRSSLDYVVVDVFQKIHWPYSLSRPVQSLKQAKGNLPNIQSLLITLSGDER